jgi:type IV secretory pathway VirB3-like protein
MAVAVIVIVIVIVIVPMIVAALVNVNDAVFVIDAVDAQGSISFVSIATMRSSTRPASRRVRYRSTRRLA